MGSKTVGHHNIPHYPEEDPKLPTAGAMSGSGGAHRGGDSQGGNLPSQDQVTAATEGHPTGQVQDLASCIAVLQRVYDMLIRAGWVWLAEMHFPSVTVGGSSQPAEGWRAVTILWRQYFLLGLMFLGIAALSVAKLLARLTAV